MKKSVKRAIRASRRKERERCRQVAAAIAARFDGMGFRHDAGKAAGAQAVLEALGGSQNSTPHSVQVVSGITQVVEGY